MTKDKLLGIGARYRTMIAADRAADARSADVSHVLSQLRPAHPRRRWAHPAPNPVYSALLLVLCFSRARDSGCCWMPSSGEVCAGLCGAVHGAFLFVVICSTSSRGLRKGWRSLAFGVAVSGFLVFAS